MKKRNKIALGIFATFYICFGIFITFNQERITYQPWAQDFETCEAFKGAEKVTYNGTRMYVQKGEKGVVVLYHGNAGSACQRDFYAEMFLQAGYGYIVPEYAGYSNDSNKPTHERIKQDVLNVVSYLQEKNVNNVLVVGESIGTGMASYHTSLKAPKKLLLISPFASLADIAKRKFWFYPSSILVDNAFDNMQLLSNYTGRTVILHGDKDTIISQRSGIKLYESIPTQQKEFVSLEGYGHNDLFDSPVTYETIVSFLNT
jgi:uncharacterized protein